MARSETAFASSRETAIVRSSYTCKSAAFQTNIQVSRFENILRVRTSHASSISCDGGPTYVGSPSGLGVMYVSPSSANWIPPENLTFFVRMISRVRAGRYSISLASGHHRVMNHDSRNVRRSAFRQNTYTNLSQNQSRSYTAARVRACSGYSL